MSKLGECLRHLGFLDTEDAGVGFAHVGEQLVLRVNTLHLGRRQPAVEAEGVIEIEIERFHDSFGKLVERFRGFDLDVA
jgi:hypothetical protein